MTTATGKPRVVGVPGKSPGSKPNTDMARFKSLLESDPAAARKLLESIASKKFVPHEGQIPVMASEARFKLVCAGRRFGKTKIAAAMALRQCRRENKMVWWVAPTYKVVKRGYSEVLRQLPDGVLTHPAPPETSFDGGRSVVLRFKTGARLEFYSAERPEGMLGEGVDFVVMDEAATMQEHIWNQIVRPTLADRRGEALFISTPRGRNWFYSMYQLGQDKFKEDYESWRFPSMTNPYIPAEEWEQMAETLPRAVYEQEILADFVSNAAAVFRFPYDEDGNNLALRKLVKPEGHVVLGVDLAKQNDFSVLCGIRAGDRQPCYHDRFNQVSWPEQRRRIHQAVDDILETASGITVMLDSTGIGDVVYDDLSFEGLDAIPIKFSPQWKQMAVMLLSADLERGLAFLHDEQLREFENYAYQITDSGRWKYEAGSGHDDEVAAMLLAHWGVVNEGVPDIQMLSTTGPALGAGEGYDVDAEGVEEVGELVLEAPSASELLRNGWW